MTGPARRLAMQAVKLASVGLDSVARPVAGATVLLYHRVGGRSGLEVDLTESLFREQIARVAESGRVSTLQSALSWMAGGGAAGPAPVVVTFDDGTRDVLDTALPVLVEHRVPATLYLATAFVEEGRDFPDQGRPVSWGALADGCSTGFLSVGSHTHDHLLLDRVAESVAVDQLDRSRFLIQERLGVEASDFAYPKAVGPSAAVARLVAQRFRSAALAGGGVNGIGADPQRLARVPIQRADGMRWFARKLEGGLTLEGRLRDAANRVRYSGASR